MKPSERTYLQKSRLHLLVRTAVMTAVTCVLAPLSIPIGPVPLSLTTLVIYLTLYLLGWRMAALSCLTYLLLGLAGMPVFSGFAGGLGKLLGPTGGYLIGFLPMAILAGVIVEKSRSRILQLLGLVAGTAVCYALGTAWFCMEAETGLGEALGLCVFPFIPGDLIKMGIAMVLGPVIRGQLAKAGMLEPCDPVV